MRHTKNPNQQTPPSKQRTDGGDQICKIDEASIRQLAETLGLLRDAISTYQASIQRGDDEDAMVAEDAGGAAVQMLADYVKWMDWCARDLHGNKNVRAIIHKARSMSMIRLTEDKEVFSRMFPIERVMDLCLKKGKEKRSFHEELSRWVRELHEEAERMQEEAYGIRPDIPQGSVDSGHDAGHETPTPAAPTPATPGAGRGEQNEVEVARGVSLRTIAEILNRGVNLEATNTMLRRWNRARLPKPEPVGKKVADIRVNLYEPTAIVDWVKKIEGYLTLPEHDLLERLTTLAEPISTDR